MRELQDLNEALTAVQALSESFAMPCAVVMVFGKLSMDAYARGDQDSARKYLALASLLLGGWILQNTESEAGELAGIQALTYGAAGTLGSKDLMKQIGSWAYWLFVNTTGAGAYFDWLYGGLF